MSATVLASARSVRSMALSRHGLRMLATEATESSFSSESRHVLPQDGQASKPHEDIKSVYVRSWDPISNMAEFFAMLRGVEKRFGTVREFRLVKDVNVSALYQSFFLIEFTDLTSMDQIPDKGTNLKVEIPVINADQPGGIGLTDLHGLLQSQERDWTLDTSGLYGATVPMLSPTDGQDSRPTRIVELVIQRAKKDTLNRYFRPFTRHNISFGTAFLKWGGFYQPRSSDEKPVSPQMAQVLDRWSKQALQEAERRRARHLQLQPQPTEAPNVATDAHEAETFVVQEAARTESAETNVEQLETHTEQVHQPPLQQPQQPLPEPSPPVELTHQDEVSAFTAAPMESASSVRKSTRSTPRLSRKEMILARAREHARAPMPDATRRAEEEERRREGKAREPPEAEVSTLRDRLLKLMGRWS